MLKRLFWWTFGIGTLLMIVLGPRPIHDPNYKHSDYYKNTLATLEKTSIASNTGKLFTNHAKIDITPTHPISLGGFSSRKEKIYEGIHDHVFAQSLSISNGGETVSIVNAEILLPLPQLVDAVVNKTGIKRELLFFNVTHTHSGPGAYQDNWVHEFSLGPFDQEYFDFLSGRLAEVIVKSRADLKPTVLKYRHFHPDRPGDLVLHSVTDRSDAYDTIHTLSFLDKEDHLSALLVSFSAHATIMGRKNNFLDGDYPGEVRRQLEQRLHAPVVFAISAPGAVTSARQEHGNGSEQQLAWRNQYATRLVEQIIKGQQSAAYTVTQGQLSSWLLPVQLRPFQLEITEKLEIASFMPELIIHPPSTYIQVLHIAGITLFGMPADYSGDLARSLEQWGEAHDCRPWVQSFNGDYIGYLSPSSLYDTPHYTTRDANFFGRWSGDYFNELAQKICNKYHSSASNP